MILKYISLASLPKKTNGEIKHDKNAREGSVKKSELLLFVCLITSGCFAPPSIDRNAVETVVAMELTQNVISTPDISTSVVILPTFPPPIDVPRTPIVQNTEVPSPVPLPSLTPFIPTPIPEIIKKTGDGDALLEIPEMGPGYQFIGITNEGEETFSVFYIDPAGNRHIQFADTTGSYSGWHLLPNDEVVNKLEIRSKGAWTVEIRPNTPDAVPEITAPTTYTGEGDTVLRVTCCSGNLPNAATFNYGGESMLIINSISGDNVKENLLNEQGPYQGMVMLPRRLRFLEIKTTGGWDMDMTVNPE